MKKFIKKVMYILSLRWIDDLKNEAVRNKICDFSGQGRE